MDADHNNTAAAAAAHRHPRQSPTPSDTALPPGWQAGFDTQYQRTYYYNHSTGETTWEKPKWEPAAAVAPVAPPEATPAALPASARWETAIDTARGKPYFYNHATGESAWALPEGATLLTDAKAGAVKTAAGEGAVGAVPAKKQREEEPEDGEVAAPSAASVAPKPDRSQETQVADNSLVEKAAASESEKLEKKQLPLPAGWAQAIDPGSGTTYYYNESLGITQWHHPSTSSGAIATGGGNGGSGGGAKKPVQQPTARINSNLNTNRQNQQAALDPMDPSSYSDTPRGGWGAGLGKDTAM